MYDWISCTLNFFQPKGCHYKSPFAFTRSDPLTILCKLVSILLTIMQNSLRTLTNVIKQSLIQNFAQGGGGGGGGGGGVKHLEERQLKFYDNLIMLANSWGGGGASHRSEGAEAPPPLTPLVSQNILQPKVGGIVTTKIQCHMSLNVGV